MHLPRAAVLLVSLLGVATAPAVAQDDPWKSFSEVTKNSQIGTGLFTIYYQRDRVLLALTPAQLDRDYLLVTQLSQGIGELGLDGGSTVRSDLVRFHRETDRIELWVVNPRFAAPEGSPMARTVAYSFGHSVAHSFPIATVREGAAEEILVDISSFLLTDWADVGSVFQAAAANRKLSINVSLDEKRSSLQKLFVYPTNLEADVRLTFQSPRNLGLETVPDYRWIPVGVHYSLLELPATPMRPRFADDRVGYFISAIKDFSRDTAESFFVRYVNRWRLEKKDPTAPISEPVRPITYYIDRTVPLDWRPYVRAGILEWNRAFEEAGFSRAIEVLDAPADSAWNAADARYSTVRWTATNRSVYAVGPSNVDPRTGEILNADILISAAWIQTWRGESNDYVAPMTSVQAILSEGAAGLLCRYGDGLTRQGTLARALLAASGIAAAGEGLPKEYIGQALKALVMHEVGHTLGLRHNFRGSAGISAEQLSDRDHTAEHGVGVSVMDYSPPALALDRRRQGDYYAPTIGSYDRWAVTYGYADVSASALSSAGATGGKGAAPAESGWTPEVELNGLHAIAAAAADPAHLYASDEEAGFGAHGLDPSVSRYDQTDDPLAWAKDRVELIDGLFDSLETRVVAPGQGYGRLRSAFTDLLTDRWYALLVTTKYLGGAVTARDHLGDPDARLPVETVPVEEQRAALAFIAAAGFGEGAYRFRPELLSRLSPDRWMHWGTSPAAAGRADFPLHDWALVQQGSLLNQLLDPAVLARVRDAELRATPERPTVSIPELFTTLTDAIWAEATPKSARNIGSVRRDLQRLQLNALIQMVVSPAAGTPEDARTIARATLGELSVRLDRALHGQRHGLEPYTRAHLIDSRERIEQALDARMIQNAASAR
ncbi:MAG: zinc-dependent metalloprotease [Gemmatimonadales bacterium]|nr:zinc-dependent metalloprotease [Gemmatimonadales bacterium]MBA3555492.1 zinc-dependent metalloprotease [Gemmatimonadales bacterium]